MDKKMAEKVACPECSSKLKIWSDLNTTVECEITRDGKLRKKAVTTSDNGECRDGIKCTECDWEIYSEQSGFEEIYSSFYDSIEGIELSIKRT